MMMDRLVDGLAHAAVSSNSPEMLVGVTEGCDGPAEVDTGIKRIGLATRLDGQGSIFFAETPACDPEDQYSRTPGTDEGTAGVYDRLRVL